MTNEEIELLDKFAIAAMTCLLQKHEIDDSFKFDECEIATTAYNIAYDMIESRIDLLNK